MEGTRGPEEEGEGDVTVTGEIRSVEVGRVEGGEKGNTCGTHAEQRLSVVWLTVLR